jgi:hypothetical protein
VNLILDPNLEHEIPGCIVTKVPEAFMLRALNDDITTVAISGDYKELPSGSQVLSWLLKERLYSGKDGPLRIFVWSESKYTLYLMRERVRILAVPGTVVVEKRPY